MALERKHFKYYMRALIVPILKKYQLMRSTTIPKHSLGTPLDEKKKSDWCPAI
jgi:hypothetical protein